MSFHLAGHSREVAVGAIFCSRQGRTHIGMGSAQVAIMVDLIIGSEGLTWVSLHLLEDSPKGHLQGKNPYRPWIYSGVHQGIFHYRLALRD